MIIIKKEKVYAERLMLYGIVVQFIIGSLFHSLYRWTGENIIIATFAPINESIWEHMKLVLLPTIIWWAGIYFIKKDKVEINRDKWFFASFISVLVSFISVPVLYYLYTGALGFESVTVDILILLVAFIFGQLVARHVYKYSENVSLKVAIVGFLVLYAVFILFTFYQPDLPIFAVKV